MGEEIKEKIWAGRRSSRLVWGLRPKLIYIIRNATGKKDGERFSCCQVQKNKLQNWRDGGRMQGVNILFCSIRKEDRT